MERQFEFLPVNRPKNFKDPLFGEYHVQVKDCRYDALNNYLTHLLFAIVMREKKLHQPAGSSGKSYPSFGMAGKGLMNNLCRNCQGSPYCNLS